MNSALRRIPFGMMWAVIFMAVVFINSIEADVPNCAYEDTVDLTQAESFPNGSYVYQGQVIPPDLIGYYDYEILGRGQIISVERHLRGCVCHLKSCVKFCCHPQSMKIPLTRNCTEERYEDMIYSGLLNITDKHGIEEEHDVFKEHIIQQGLPCAKAYITKRENGTIGWRLHENGTVEGKYDQNFRLTKNDYCLYPYSTNETDFELGILFCTHNEEQPSNTMVNIIVMCLSIPFIFATIFVYAFIRELRNLHGKCLIAYLSALGLGNTVLCIVNILGIMEVIIDETVCFAIGLTTYFSYIAAFLWLSVISLDLWYNFQGTNSRASRYIQHKRFYWYSLFAWSTALIFTVLTFLAQISNLPDSLKSGIGGDNCWLDTTQWSLMIYFYGPMLVILIFNTTVFTLTALKIYRVQKELSNFATKDENIKHVRSQKDEFGMFLRLFVVMGIIWFFEILSYMVGNTNYFQYIFYPADFLNSANGIVIFLLFVLKPRVWMLIKKRCCAGSSVDLPFHGSRKFSQRSISNGHFSGMSLTQDTDI